MSASLNEHVHHPGGWQHMAIASCLGALIWAAFGGLLIWWLLR